jgi:predicted CXXCH cytochrome family protein
MKNLQLGLLITFFATGLVYSTCLGETGQPASGHESADCRKCHLRAASTGSSLVSDNGTCLGCHSGQVSSRVNGLGFHGKRSQDRCLECHSYHKPGTVTTMRGFIELDSLEQLNPGHCLSCHDGKGSLQSLSEAHLVAATLYHEQAQSLQDISPSQACLNCHSNTSATDWQQTHGGDAMEFSEHSTHPYEVEVVPGRGGFGHRIRHEIDPAIPLFENKIQCQTCHQLTSERPDLIVAFDEPTDLCLGCHQFRDRDPEKRDPLVTAMARP